MKTVTRLSDFLKSVLGSSEDAKEREVVRIAVRTEVAHAEQARRARRLAATLTEYARRVEMGEVFVGHSLSDASDVVDAHGRLQAQHAATQDAAYLVFDEATSDKVATMLNEGRFLVPEGHQSKPVDVLRSALRKAVTAVNVAEEQEDSRAHADATVALVQAALDLLDA